MPSRDAADVVVSGRMEASETVARLDTASGEVVLRRVLSTSGSSAFELIVNGIFLMSSDGGASERMLATECLAALPEARGLSVLIGGLGLGLTLRTALDDARVSSVHVSEIEPEVVRWNQSTLCEVNGGALTDSRVTVAVEDVRHAIEGSTRRFDAILLDVDNGPTWITRPENAPLYDYWALRAMRRALCRPGVLGIWSDKPAQVFYATLTSLFDEVVEIRVDSVSIATERAGPDIIYCATVL
jgi:spermidine synthase